MDNNNKWAKNENEEVVIQKTTTLPSDAVESNTSRKMGIAMGVVGIVLVAAGVIPLFMDSSGLQGDASVSAQLQISEPVDPLVALLSGTNAPTQTATAKPTVQATPQVLSAVVETPMPTIKPTAKSEVETILESKNVHVGTSDTTGSSFHNAAALNNTSAQATPKTTPKATTNPTHNVANTGPDTTPTTGSEMSVLLLGFSLLFAGAWYSRRRS